MRQPHCTYGECSDPAGSTRDKPVVIRDMAAGASGNPVWMNGRPFSSFLLGSMLHGQGIGAGIFASQDETEEHKDHNAAPAPGFISRQQSNQHGHVSEAHPWK
jgi:hypothetical protein